MPPDRARGRRRLLRRVDSEAQALAGESVCIVSGSTSAGRRRSAWPDTPAAVAGSSSAATAGGDVSRYLIDAIDKDPNVRGADALPEVVAGLGDGRLEQLELRTPDGIETVPAAALIVLIGAHRTPMAAGRSPGRVGLSRRRPIRERGWASIGAAAGSTPARCLQAATSAARGQAVHLAQAGALAVSDATPISPWNRGSMARSPLTLVVPSRLPGRARDPARGPRDVRSERHPSRFWLVSCRRAERRPRLRDRVAASRRAARPPRLALVPRGLRLPRPARARDARRPARQAESAS